jgi:hypothetical protein
MLDTALQDSWITMTGKEKEAFYARYLLHLKMSVDADGKVNISDSRGSTTFLGCSFPHLSPSYTRWEHITVRWCP